MQAADIENIIFSRSPVGLKDLENVQLLNRIERKYILPAGKLPGVLEKLDGRYRVLEIGSTRIFPYLTRYFDTDGFLFFNQHVSGRPVRHKVRYRTYESTGISFLELKKRIPRARTIKWRIEKQPSSEGELDETAYNFINEHMQGFIPVLIPVMMNSFNRITLAGTGFNERVTIDYNLSFTDMAGNIARYPFFSVIELKKEGYGYNSPMAGIMREMSVSQCGFSKYCFGISTLYDIPRRNLIRNKYSLIRKIENDPYRYSSA